MSPLLTVCGVKLDCMCAVNALKKKHKTYRVVKFAQFWWVKFLYFISLLRITYYNVSVFLLCICTVYGTAKTAFNITMSTDNLNSWHTKVLRVTLATSGSFKTLFMTSTFQIKLSFPLILTRLSEFKTRPDCDEWQHCIQSSQRSQWKLYSIRKQQGRVPQSHRS